MSKPIVTDITKVTQEYKSGKSAGDIAKEWNTSSNVITAALKRHGVTLRTKSETAKLKIKQHGYTPVKFTKKVRAKMSANHADVKGSKNPKFKGKGQYAKDGTWLTYDNNGYLRRKMPSHPLAQKDGYIGEHIVIACKKYGVNFVDGREVHHLDCNKSNNNPDNIVVMTRTEHRRFESNFKKRHP